MSTNDWHITQNDEEYLDVEKELISFADEGNSSVDLRLTFDKSAHSAHLVLMRRNEDGNTAELLPKDIWMEWGAAIAYLGDAAKLLPAGMVAVPVAPDAINSMDKVIRDVIAACGGDVNGESRPYPREDWRHEVENSDTNLGYWEWVVHAAESDGIDLFSKEPGMSM